jgi:hypothetical protein
MESLAFDMAEVAVRDGIPARWLTDQEVRAVLDGGNRSIKGFCFHRQIDPETRTDPGGGYPADLLMQRIQFYMTGGTTLTPQSTTTPTQDEDIMADIADLKNTLLDPEVLEAIGKAVHTRPVPYFDPETGQDTGTGTTLAVLAGASDFQHSATRRTLASAAGAIVDAVKAAQPADAAQAAQAAYDEFVKKLDATTIKVAVNG